jgi:hypothetical protein
MIRHIVMWRVKGDSPQDRHEASLRIKRSFEGLRGRIPGLRHIEVGIDSSRVDYACDTVLVTEFETLAALTAYPDHPEHLRVRAELGRREPFRRQPGGRSNGQGADRAVRP